MLLLKILTLKHICTCNNHNNIVIYIERLGERKDLHPSKMGHRIILVYLLAVFQHQYIWFRKKENISV